MTITRDATSGWWLPQSSTEWAEFVRGTPVATPDALWLFQEPSGNFADSIGAFTLTAGASLTYQNAVSGWTTKGVNFTDGSATSTAQTTSASLPDVSTASLTVLGLWQLTTPSVAHDFLNLGTASIQRAILTTTPAMKMASSTNNTTGTSNPTGAIHPFVFVSNHTAATAALISDQETLSVAIATPSGKSLTFGGTSVASCGGSLIYGAAWMNANAEMTTATITQLIKMFKQGPNAGNPLTFDMLPRRLPPALSPAAIASSGPLTPPPGASGPTNTAALGYYPDRLPPALARRGGALGGLTAPPAAPLGTTDTAALVTAPDRARARPHAPIADGLAPGPVTPSAAAPPTYPWPTFPDAPRARAAAANPATGLTGPLTAPPPIGPTDVAMLAVFPHRMAGRTYPAAQWQAYASGFLVTFLPPYGTAGAGTFVVSLESGAQVTLQYATEVQKTWSGAEYRTALLSQPRQLYRATAHLADASSRDARAQLITGAAAGSAFLLGLAYEEATFTGPASGAVVPVSSTAILDWAIVRQRVIVVGVDGSTVQGSIQGLTATSITLGDANTGAALTLTGPLAAQGARIMPLVPVFLDPQQSFARHPVSMEEWQLAARASVFGYVGSDTFGTGATVATYADATWGTLPIWDRGVDATSQIADSLQTLADLVDLGGVPGNVGSAAAVEAGRQLVLTSERTTEWQWLKAFLAAVRGRQGRFGVSTARPDLVFWSNPGSGSLLVRKGTGYGDPTQYSDNAHERLAILKTDGTTQLVFITNVGDNFDGTVTLTLDQTVTGTVAMISYFETCRFESDSFDVQWHGVAFTFSAVARVVQQ